MITVRKAGDRGTSNFGWLDSKHTFSFGQYMNRAHMGFGPLRVINEDRVAGGAGFGAHPHDNMEIISIVLDGALAHKDGLGTGSVIRAGDVQRMSAGTGITHSEFNASETDPVHFLQIWVLPEARGLAPGYEQKSFASDARRGKLALVGSRDGREGAVTIHQDVDLYATELSANDEVRHAVRPGRRTWVQVTKGGLDVNGVVLDEGDGAAIEAEDRLVMRSKGDAEALLFDMR